MTFIPSCSLLKYRLKPGIFEGGVFNILQLNKQVHKDLGDMQQLAIEKVRQLLSALKQSSAISAAYSIKQEEYTNPARPVRAFCLLFQHFIQCFLVTLKY